jgi:hypothetical protein
LHFLLVISAKPSEPTYHIARANTCKSAKLRCVELERFRAKAAPDLTRVDLFACSKCVKTEEYVALARPSADISACHGGGFSSSCGAIETASETVSAARRAVGRSRGRPESRSVKSEV